MYVGLIVILYIEEKGCHETQAVINELNHTEC